MRSRTLLPCGVREMVLLKGVQGLVNGRCAGIG
jgi:hypothetical protein